MVCVCRMCCLHYILNDMKWWHIELVQTTRSILHTLHKNAYGTLISLGIYDDDNDDYDGLISIYDDGIFHSTVLLFSFFILLIFFSWLCRAFQSGFESEPVMCQTINTFYDKNYCELMRSCSHIKRPVRMAIFNNFLFDRVLLGPWVSCGEWCLTKTSGYCPQIHATSRRNGTDIQLENCTRITTTTCPEVRTALSHILYCLMCSRMKYAQSAQSACTVQPFDVLRFYPRIFSHFLMPCIVHQVKQDIFKSKYNCNNGTECASLTGLFDCSLGKYGFLFNQLNMCARPLFEWVCICVLTIPITLCTQHNLSFA